MTPVRDSLHRLAARIHDAHWLTVLTGAGVSAASGVPTFRGADGLWRNYLPEDLATPQAFSRDPHLVWEWYAWRRETIARCRPNAAHDVIAAWSRRFPVGGGLTVGSGHETRRPGAPGCRVVTQNVDDLHLRAGTADLVRLHGSIWELSCWMGGDCPTDRRRWRDERVPLPDLPPRCPLCGGLARPAVVWFGESLRAEDMEQAQQAADCDVFLAIGTSAVVYPAAGLLHFAKRRGAFTAEINLDPTPASTLVDLAIHGQAEEILPELEGLANAD